MFSVAPFLPQRLLNREARDNCAECQRDKNTK